MCVSNLPATARVNYQDDNDADIVQLYVMATQSDVKSMVVGQAGTDQTIIHPSEFEYLNPRQDCDSVPDPAFNIDDVYMEPTDRDVDATQDIVPRGTWMISMVL